MATQPIANNVSSLFLNEEYSDMHIVVGGVETFPAHKNIVCPRSGYFQRACRNFKEASGRIEFEDKDPVLIRTILEYLYKGSYEPAPCQGIPELKTSPADTAPVDTAPADSAPVDTASTDSATTNSAPNHPSPTEVAKFNTSYFYARLHGEADYFMIDDLKSDTKKRFYVSLPASVGFKSFLPDRQGKKDHFVAIVTELYSQNANYRQLRALLVQYILKNLSSFRGPSSTFHIMDDDLLKDIPDFTFDLCRAMLVQNSKQQLTNAIDPSRTYNSPTFGQPATPQGSGASQQSPNLLGGSRGGFSFSAAARGANTR